MDFVELNRWFAPVRKDQELDASVGRRWGARHYGWMDWPRLRGHRRVVLLAEAASGKSEEFRNQARVLAAEGKSSFILRIEELADQGFAAALGPQEATAFDNWLSGNSDGWFFLDSVDEARLNRKSFAAALKRFAREMGDALERASIFVSCRVTDWKEPGDRRAIADWLPCHRRAVREPEKDDDDRLLGPIFDEKQGSEQKSGIDTPKLEDLLVVQLVPLDGEQAATLAAAAGVANKEAFSAAIIDAGLDVFRQRPGDVLDLAGYWVEHGRFGTLSDMVDYGVERKLAERDAHRPDNDVLAPAQARQGAEQLAAALTLGKTFTVRAPGAEADPSLTAGALDPATVLTTMSDAARAALLRRGIFAPATFGRVRFHHRATQEYLTARWLHRLMEAGCSAHEVQALVFAERYGVMTVVPSLRPAAAWLAQWHPAIRDEIIRRAPMVLMQYGDPRSLDIDARRRLLTALADKHARGDVPDTSLDSRSFALFADARLADTITTAWAANDHVEFRSILLGLIREGAIKGCEAILRDAATSTTNSDYHRLVALEGMIACGDDEAINAFVRGVLDNPAAVTLRMAAGIAEALYPRAIGTEDVLRLIAETELPGGHAGRGFSRSIASLYHAAPSPDDRHRLVDGIAALSLSPPLVETFNRVSARYGQLASHIQAVAAAEIRDLGDKPPRDGLVQLLMAVERAARSASLDDDEPPLHQMVTARPSLNRALMWADVADMRASRELSRPPLTRHWHVYFGADRQLWGGGPGDVGWLAEDAADRPDADDRSIAFSLLYAILDKEQKLDQNLPQLEALAALHLELASDLAGYRAPPVEHEESSKFRREQAARKAKREKDDEKSRASWVNFRTALQADPDQLRRPENLASWKAGMFRLRDLTYWLEHKTAHGDDRAPRDWRLLEEGFGRPVAEAYRDGMTALWRVVEPARPLRTDGGGITRQWPNVLAYAGIGIAAGEAGDWADRLGEPEAERCARHACMAEEGCPEWLDRLVVAHPRAVLPLLEGELVREWQIAERWHADFLYRYASREVALSPPVQELLVKTFASGETAHAETLERAIAIVAKLDLDMTRRSELAAMSAARFTSHAAAGNEAFAIGYLAIRFLVDPAAATAALTEWLAQDAPAPGVTRAARTLSRLFDGHHNGLIVGALDHTSVAMLEQLLQCAYRHIRPADDVHHVGTFSPDSRDGAETARNTILSKLMDRPGADAFWTIRKLADEPEFADRLQRFRELAHEKAERDSEPPAWRPSEVCAFAETHTSPAKTGADLLRVVLGVLDDINFQLHKGDVTSRPLLERATGENEVRNWLTEQLTLRARGRFHAYREAEVADSDRPDIVVASTSAQCEIAIEVKHGGKPWSLRQLDHALHTQLAEDYLKPETRRYGILVISQHDNRVRIDTETGERLEFNELIARLKDAARAIVRNSSGAIEVTCVGIDATEQQVP